jgi:hypothetical protein
MATAIKAFVPDRGKAVRERESNDNRMKEFLSWKLP